MKRVSWLLYSTQYILLFQTVRDALNNVRASQNNTRPQVTTTTSGPSLPGLTYARPGPMSSKPGPASSKVNAAHSTVNYQKIAPTPSAPSAPSNNNKGFIDLTDDDDVAKPAPVSYELQLP